MLARMTHVSAALLGLAGLLLAADPPSEPPSEPPGPKVGDPAPEIQAGYWVNSPPLRLEALRGRIVIVEFWATWCPPCRTSIPHLNKLHQTYGKQGVVIVGLTREPADRVKPFAREIGMAYPVGGDSQSGGAYGVRGIPHAFIVDPSGKVVWRGHPMANLDEALEAQIEKTPPTMMTAKEKAVALAMLDRADAALAEDDLAKAAGVLAKVERPDDDPAVRKRFAETRAALTERVEQAIAEAEKKIEAKAFYDAAAALSRLMKATAGTEASAKAKARLEALLADPEARAAIETTRRQAAADALLAQAPTDDPLARIKVLDQVAARYPATPAGAKAAEEAAAMRANPETARRLREAAAAADCTSWLAMARNFIKADLPEKARPYLEKILETYGDTSFAAEARELLATLPKQ